MFTFCVAEYGRFAGGLGIFGGDLVLHNLELRRDVLRVRLGFIVDIDGLILLKPAGTVGNPINL
jgi:hypothetical protein